MVGDRRAWQAVQKTYVRCGKAWLDDGSRATCSYFNPYQKWKTEECVPKKHCPCTRGGGQRVLCWMLVVPGGKGWPRTGIALPGRPVVMGGRFGVFCAWNWWGACGTSGTPSFPGDPECSGKWGDRCKGDRWWYLSRHPTPGSGASLGRSDERLREQVRDIQHLFAPFVLFLTFLFVASAEDMAVVWRLTSGLELGRAQVGVTEMIKRPENMSWSERQQFMLSFSDPLI